MLVELRIKNLAILDQVELLLEPGFNVFTGETGAGKSMLVQAVHLLLGAKGSEDLIRTGAPEAEVEARFEIVSKEPWTSWLAERELPFANELLLRRVVSRSGRSRSYLNDQAATLKFLAASAQELINLSGQHEHQTFLAPENHLHILDSFAGLTDFADDFRTAYQHWRQLEKLWQQLQQRQCSLENSKEFLIFQVQELDSANLHPGEEEELASEQERLRHATQLFEAARAGYDRLYGNKASLITGLTEVKKNLELLARFDADWSARLTKVADITLELEDLAFDLRDYSSSLHRDPGHLEEIDQRLHLLQRLRRKYGSTLTEVIDYLEKTRQELNNLDNLELELAELAAQVKAACQSAWEKAEILSQRRREAAPLLAAAVETEIHGLAMPQARFSVKFWPLRTSFEGSEVQQKVLGVNGLDQVEFFLAPNPGEDPKPLSRIASGGELSRLVLGLKNILAIGAGVHTSIFDEVDAGIGGATATVVGQKLRRLAQTQQIICITHLPHIACFADTHFRVEKQVIGARTVTMVKKLTPEERLQELARMLGGALVTDTTLAHAKEMLTAARPFPAAGALS